VLEEKFPICRGDAGAGVPVLREYLVGIVQSRKTAISTMFIKTGNKLK
jgi:hypothetical protein